jgi:hypothetical protein
VFEVLEPGRQDLVSASRSCFQERQPPYRAAHFIFAGFTAVPRNRNITNRQGV